jgi:hypothetical protein
MGSLVIVLIRGGFGPANIFASGLRPIDEILPVSSDHALRTSYDWSTLSAGASGKDVTIVLDPDTPLWRLSNQLITLGKLDMSVVLLVKCFEVNPPSPGGQSSQSGRSSTSDPTNS